MDNSLEHSEKFIRSKVGNNTRFSTPKNYFNGIENMVFSTLSESSIPKNLNFDVPTDYFSKLEDTILAKVASEEKEVKVISLRDSILRFIPVAAAASVLLFIGINYFTTNNTISFEDITSADLDSWYENDSEEINSNDLALVFEASDFEEDIFSETTIEDISIEEYLNSVDNSGLLIE